MQGAFYYDIVCPYAYMAFSLLHRQGIFAKGALALEPILLGGLFKLMEQSPNPNARMSQDRAHYIQRDIARQASFYDIPLTINSRHPISTLKAMRMLVACPLEKREALSLAFYKAYWQHGQDIDDEAILATCARRASFSLADYDEGKAKELLHAKTSEAFHAKVFGVPSIALNKRLYFGSDRLPLLAESLGLTLPETPWAKSKASLDFYFDFASPYSYLAHAEMLKAEKAGVHINYIPILLGALFKERGVANVPILAAHPHKASYYLQDMHDWAHARNVPLVFNSAFPLRSVNALRLALCAPSLKGLIFEAAWALDQDIGDQSVLLTILQKAGLSPSLLEEAQVQSIKDQLKENTENALKRGVFGVPTFGIGDELVFGQDRFPWLKARLSALNIL